MCYEICIDCNNNDIFFSLSPNVGKIKFERKSDHYISFPLSLSLLTVINKKNK